MPMRDDREALRARIEALTGDLDAAERSVSELREAAAERDALAKERDRLARELDKAKRALGKSAEKKRRSPQRAQPTTLAVIGIVLGSFGAFAGWYVFSRIDSTSPGVPGGANTAPGARTAGGAPNAWHTPFVLRASVRTARGIALTPGSPCEISGVISDTTNVSEGSPEQLRVACGSAVLYDTGEVFAGVSQSSASARYLPVPGGGTRALITAEDVGVRSGRASLELDSWHGRAALTRTDGDPYEVTLNVEVATNRFTRASTSHTARDREAQSAVLRVTSSEGVNVPAVGAHCEVRLRGPDATDTFCHARVYCDAPLYDGYYECADAPTSFVDARPSALDRDAQIDVDLAAQTLTFFDTDGSGGVRAFEAAAASAAAPATAD